MIDERTLPDHLDAAVAGVTPDLHRIAAGAERRGRRLRLRRRVAALATTCAVTAAVVGGVGWLSGQAAESVFGNIRHLEVWLFVGVILFALVIWLVRR